MKKRVAGIDIGSNTILMLIADVEADGSIKVIRDENAIARLGEGVNENKNLKAEAIERSLKILSGYKSICDAENVDVILPVATSAMRDAQNGQNTAELFSEVLQAKVEIISGPEEARLTFIGSIEDRDNCTVIDIGGGSTEFISGADDSIAYKSSINIGAVRIKEMFFPQHPPTLEQISAAQKFIIENLDKIDKSEIHKYWYAVAGSPTSVAAIHLGLREFDYDRIHLFQLSTEIIEEVWEIIMTHSVQDIVDKYNMHPRRADIIAAGVLTLKTSLAYFSNPNCSVSVKGLRFGIIKNYAKGI